MAGSPLYAGFDLGTSNSAAAVFDGERVTVIRNAQGGTITPSVVRIDRTGRATVGVRARRFLEQDPDNTATEFKRLMGTGRRIAFPAAGVERTPEELAAELLRALRGDLADQLGVAAVRAVVSVPALFELPQSAATSEAARLAGFERVELLQEPIASALAAGWRADGDAAAESWLVYDLGGGTLDVSLLESRDGLLRVVGHDGDNFLGGRDFDWAITEHVAARLAEAGGLRLARGEPGHAAPLRALKLACEDAKIELSRAERTQIAVVLPPTAAGEVVEVDVELARETVERLCAPIVERSLEVCLRLLASAGLAPGRLGKIVLVGGPTVMPLVRSQVAARLEAPLGEGLDPMTLVAQGAALYAATAGLDGRAAAAAPGRGRPVWLQYPAVSSDLTPHVVGRFVGEAPPSTVVLARSDGGWQGPAAQVGPDGGFVTTVSLEPRRASTFRIEARAGDGAPVPVVPETFTIVQGLTIGDPPLSRTIGVALADDRVQVYFERGAPLPARRTFTHHTVETVARGSAVTVLKIPIIQGELDQAHLCRMVGSLEIAGAEVKDTIPLGAPVEVTIELDRGGRMSARAWVPAIDQVFESVAHLLVPEADPEALDAALGDLRRQLVELRTDAFRHNLGAVLARLDRVEARLAEAERDIDAAHGGDADAAQKARRTLLEVDAVLTEADLAGKWPELDAEARVTAIHATGAVAHWGSEAEKRLLDEVIAAMEKARADRNPGEMQRQLRLVQRLASAARARDPDHWSWQLDWLAADVARAHDLPRAQRLVAEGKGALERGDLAALKRAVRALWDLMPEDAEARQRAFESGVR
jgi:molecular chaperone DnaK